MFVTAANMQVAKSTWFRALYDRREVALGLFSLDYKAVSGGPGTAADRERFAEQIKAVLVE
jgi:hypothetical protein